MPDRIIAKQISDYFVYHNILPIVKPDFSAHHSYCTPFLKIINSILETWDKKLTTILVLLDYSKAFNTIDRKLHCHILGYIGLSEISVNPAFY